MATALSIVLTAPGPTGAAGTDTWLRVLADPAGVEVFLELGPDDVHHVLAATDISNSATYHTDRGNAWRTTALQGRPVDLELDDTGHVYILTIDEAGPTLTTDLTGTLASERIPGVSQFRDTYDDGALLIGSDGTVHAVFGAGGYKTLIYTSRANGVWADPQTIDDTIVLSSMALAADSSGTLHVIASGWYWTHKPAGCSAGLDRCTVDIALAETPVVTPIVSTVYVWLDAVAGDSGRLDVVGADGKSLDHLTNGGGSWASGVIETANILKASISRGPSGLVAFWDDGANGGVSRGDFDGTGWTIAVVDPGRGGPIAVGMADAQNRSHFVSTVSYWHEDGGYLPSVYIGAPDTAAPITGAPRIRPAVGKKVGTRIPMRVSWAATDAMSGIATYRLRESRDGTWSASTVLAPAVRRNLIRGATYAFNVRATDRDGNVGAFASGPAVKVSTAQQTAAALTYRGTWHSVRSTTYWHGSARYASSRRASVTYTGTMRAFGWVGTRGPRRGSFDIYVDGSWVSRVSTHRAKSANRVLVWSISWAESGRHSIRLVPAGTTGHARVDVDGIVLVR